MEPAIVAALITAAIGVPLGGWLGASLAHRRWVQEARLERYAAFTAAAHDSLDEYLAHAGQGPNRVEALRRLNRDLQSVRLVASFGVDTRALALLRHHEVMREQSLAPHTAYERHLVLLAAFLDLARLDVLVHSRLRGWTMRMLQQLFPRRG